MTILIVLLLVTLLVLVWVLHGRSWLKARPWGWSRRLFAWLDPIEIALWRKSETILFARFKVLIGVVLTLLTNLGQLDLTPLVAVFPERHQSIARTFITFIPLTITMLGMVDEYLRRTTTKPLDVVSVSDMAPAEVKAAVREVEKTNREAVATVNEAKAEGKT